MHDIGTVKMKRTKTTRNAVQFSEVDENNEKLPHMSAKFGTVYVKTNLLSNPQCQHIEVNVKEIEEGE